MDNKNNNQDFQLKCKPVSASIGKFYSNKVVKKNNKTAIYSRIGNKSSNSKNNIDKKNISSSTFSTCTQSLYQFVNNNNNVNNNKNLADVLNDIINSKLKGSKTPLNNKNKYNINSFSKKSLSPSQRLNNLLRDMKVRFSKKYIDTLSYRLFNNLPNENNKNMNSLQKMIDILKDYEKDKFEKKKNEKLEKKEQINDNIEKLDIFLKTYKLEKKKNDYEQFKLQKKINTLLYVSQKYCNSAKELENIAFEIENLGKQIKELNEETNENKKLYSEEENNIFELKKIIGLTNKNISNIQKEIDNIIPGINYLNKHIKEIKNKISSKEHFNSHFFLNMVNMVETVNSKK